jgi:predicted RNase H-like nuclease (RuvC/YqgF family)
MGIFGGKTDLELMVEPYKMQIEMLKEHIDRLEKQNKSLLEAVMASKSPDAYREMKADEAALANFKEVSPEENRKRELEYEVKRKWLEAIEAPTFNSFEEFESFLQRQNPPSEATLESEPLHPNNPES